MRNRFGGAGLSLVWCVAISIMMCQSVSASVVSTFDGSVDGWKVVSVLDSRVGPYDATVAGPYTPKFGCNHISQVDPGGEDFYFQAPAKFLGNQSAAYGHSLSFDVSQIAAGGSPYYGADVVLVGAGLVLVADAGDNPSPAWTHYSVPFTESAWKKGSLSGAAPTKNEFTSVLSALTALRIRGEYISGSETHALANVCLNNGGSAIRSSFATGNDGWGVVDLRPTNYAQVVGTPYVPVWNAGGNPTGYAWQEDPDNNVWYWQAPTKFLGNQSTAYGLKLRYDLKQIYQSGTNLPDADLALVGAGTVLVADGGADPGSSWTSYAITLTENGGWRKGTLNGPPPTKEEFLAVLSSLSMLRIRGEFIDGGDTSGLDNVVLERTSHSVVSAKQSARWTQVTIDQVSVSAVFADCFYVQDDAVPCGVEVRKAGYQAEVGTRVDIIGVVDTDANGERYIDAASTEPSGTSNVTPLWMPIGAVGGSNWIFDPTAGAGQEGIPGVFGLCNTGLLVRLCGRIVFADQGGDYIVVSDGSNRLTDGGYSGIRIQRNGIELPVGTNFVTVTGISSRCVIDGHVYPQVRAVLIQ